MGTNARPWGGLTAGFFQARSASTGGKEAEGAPSDSLTAVDAVDSPVESGESREIVHSFASASLPAAEAEATSYEPLPCVSAAFIHEIIPRKEQLSSLTSTADRQIEDEWKEMNVFFHKTYVGAALNAYRYCDLISKNGLARVCKAAVVDLVRLRTDMTLNVSESQWEQITLELNRDIEEANKELDLPAQVPFAPVPKDDLHSLPPHFFSTTAPRRSVV